MARREHRINFNRGGGHVNDSRGDVEKLEEIHTITFL